MSWPRRAGPGRLGKAVLRGALLTWPRHARARDGESMLRALADASADRPIGALGLLAESTAIAWAGLRLRRAAILGPAPLRDGSIALRQAARSLRRAPAYAATVIFTFAVGIGANAAVLGIVHGVLWTDPPFDHPDRLTFVWRTVGTDSERFRISGSDAAELAARTDAFDGVAFVARPRDGGLESSDGSPARHVAVGLVSPELFELLGVRPRAGRTFTADDAVTASRSDGAPAPAVALISHDLWERVFEADPAVLGRTVRIDGSPARIVGVLGPEARLAMPPDVGMGAPVDLWTPLRVPLSSVGRSDGRAVDEDSDDTGAVIARLRDGVSLADARRETLRVAADLRAEQPEYEAASVGLTVRPMHEDATDHLRPLLLALSLGTGVLLLVACLNLSTLSLARSTRRRRELVVRAALGAPRSTLLRTVVTESVLLAAVAAVVAMGAGRAAFTALSRAAPERALGPLTGSPDPAVLLVWVGLATLASIVCSVVPMVGVIGRVQGSADVLRSRDPLRSRGILVATQVALSVLLLVATTTLVQAVREAYSIRPGFEPEGAVTWAVSVRFPGDYRGPADRARLMREIETSVRAVPSVRSVGFTTHLPLSGRRWTQPYGSAGQPSEEWARNRADFRTVSSGYFDAMGIRLLEGRAFTREEDLAEEERVVIVDRTLADRISRAGSAVGASLGIPLDGRLVQARVVGVVEHVRHDRLDADGRETIYVPYRQEASREVRFVARVDGAPSEVMPRVRAALAAVDTRLPVYALRPLSSYVADQVAPTTFGIGVVGTFAALVLLSVGIGLYGVIALDVSQRTREIGVRLAIGARRAHVVRTVLAGGIRVVAAGLAAGVLLTLAASGILARAARGSSPMDPAVWSATLLGVLLVAAAATWLPARRASRLSPIEALRTE